MRADGYLGGACCSVDERALGVVCVDVEDSVLRVVCLVWKIVF